MNYVLLMELPRNQNHTPLVLSQGERSNALVLAWIMNSVSNQLYAGIVYSTDVRSVWSNLKGRFENISGS